MSAGTRSSPSRSTVSSIARLTASFGGQRGKGSSPRRRTRRTPAEKKDPRSNPYLTTTSSARSRAQPSAASTSLHAPSSYTSLSLALSVTYPINSSRPRATYARRSAVLWCTKLIVECYRTARRPTDGVDKLLGRAHKNLQSEPPTHSMVRNGTRAVPGRTTLGRAYSGPSVISVNPGDRRYRLNFVVFNGSGILPLLDSTRSPIALTELCVQRSPTYFTSSDPAVLTVTRACRPFKLICA